MCETPAPRDPGQGDDLPGTPAGPGDFPEPGSPDWRLVSSSPDWLPDEAYAQDDEGPDELEEYEDPDSAPPPGLNYA
jgi:hypothetical protein